MRYTLGQSKKWIDFLTSHSQVNLTPLISRPSYGAIEEVLSLANLPGCLGQPRCPIEAQSLTGPHVGFPVLQSHASSVKNLWKGVALRNISGSSHHLIVNNIRSGFGEDYKKQIRDFASFKWTPASETLPLLMTWVRENIEPYFHIGFLRVMFLHPGGVVPPHRDLPLNASNDLVAKTSSYNILNSLHFAVSNPKDCFFIHNGRVLPFEDQPCWFLNNSYTHWAKNFSDSIRAHIILQGVAKKSLRNYVEVNYSRLETYGI